MVPKKFRHKTSCKFGILRYPSGLPSTCPKCLRQSARSCYRKRMKHPGAKKSEAKSINVIQVHLGALKIKWLCEIIMLNMVCLLIEIKSCSILVWPSICIVTLATRMIEGTCSNSETPARICSQGCGYCKLLWLFGKSAACLQESCGIMRFHLTVGRYQPLQTAAGQSCPQ